MTDPDLLQELRFALAEGDAVAPPLSLRSKVLDAALMDRPAGRATGAPAHISGDEVFRRAVQSFDGLLATLGPAEWARPTIRGLDVQGLVGHLIGVEADFAGALEGTSIPAGSDQHVSSTEGSALRQAGRLPAETHAEWSDAAQRSLQVVAARPDLSTPATFYGVTFPLDGLLVIRAFEMWIHDEDIRRATGRPLAPPDAERLARMATLAVTLLPVGVDRVGRTPDQTVRLVLTGRGGGTWDIPLGTAREGERATARVVVDTTEFCRVVGDRQSQTGARAVVAGDPQIADAVFAGAAALALD